MAESESGIQIIFVNKTKKLNISYFCKKITIPYKIDDEYICVIINKPL